MKAKILSWVFMILSVVFVLASVIIYIYKAGKLPSSDEAKAIIEIGIFIKGCTLPIDVSMIIKTIKLTK